MTAYNALVDQCNAWVLQHFGENPDVLLSKMNIDMGTSLNPKVMPPYLSGVAQRNPFNESTDLSKFGNQGVLTQLSSEVQQNRNILRLMMLIGF